MYLEDTAEGKRAAVFSEADIDIRFVWNQSIWPSLWVCGFAWWTLWTPDTLHVFNIHIWTEINTCLCILICKWLYLDYYLHIIFRFNLNTCFEIIVHQLFYSMFISKLLAHPFWKSIAKEPFLHCTLYVLRIVLVFTISWQCLDLLSEHVEWKSDGLVTHFCPCTIISWPTNLIHAAGSVVLQWKS